MSRKWGGIAVLWIIQAVLGCGTGTNPSAPPLAGAKGTIKNTKLEELQYSKLCSEAAEGFWKRYNEEPQLERNSAALYENISYVSHYNKSINKCLVCVTWCNINKKGNTSASDVIYDSFEGKEIGNRITITTSGSMNPSGTKVVLMKEGSVIETSPENLAWFNDLMTE